MATTSRNKKQKRGNSTSNSENVIHPMIRERLNPESRSRYIKLWNNPVKPNKYLEMDELREEGLRARVEAHIQRVGWGRLIEIREPSFHEIFIEFLASLHVEQTYYMLQRPHTKLSFNLCGMKFNLTITQFAVACGFYTEEETEGEQYLTAIYDKPSETNYQDIWSRLTTNGGNYDANRSKSSRLTDKALKIIHRFMSYTVTGRSGASNGIVSQVDLVCLHAMTEERWCNLGVLFARYYHKISLRFAGKRNEQGTAILLGGSFITRLARNLGVLNLISRWTKLHEMMSVGQTFLNHMDPTRGGRRRTQGRQDRGETDPETQPEETGQGSPHPQAAFLPTPIDQQPSSFDLKEAIEKLGKNQEEMSERMDEMFWAMEDMQKIIFLMSNTMKQILENQGGAPLPQPPAAAAAASPKPISSSSEPLSSSSAASA